MFFMSSALHPRPNDSERARGPIDGNLSFAVNPRRPIDQGASSVVCCLDHKLLARLTAHVSQSIAATAPRELLGVVTLGGVRLVVADPSVADGECGRMLIKL